MALPVEKKEIVPFRDKLRAEMGHSFKKIALVIGLSYLFILTFFILLLQYSQLMQGKRMVQSYFEEIDATTSRVFEDLEAGNLESFISGNISEREMFRQIYEETNQLPFRSTLAIYSADKELLLTTRLPNRDGLKDDAYVKIALNNLGRESLFKIMKDHQSNNYLIKLKAIYQENEIEGYLVLYIDSNDFKSSVESEAIQYVITDYFDNLFASNSSRYDAESLEKIDGASLSRLLSLRQGNLYLANKTLLNKDLYLYTYILVVPLTYLFAFTGLFATVIIFILFAASNRLSRKITLHSSDSIDILVSDLDLMMKGFKESVAVSTDDEFGYLADKINKMVETMQLLFEQTLQSEQEKARCERKLLEAQFNPHFLYNALEAIKILMYFDVKKAEQMILSLNRVLRYSVTSISDYGFLADDLAIIEDYLLVNQVRFEELTYTIDYPNHLSELTIPRLFLLPLVDNALKHGMKDRHALDIGLTVKEENGKILFTVADNGSGFSEDFLAVFADYIHTDDTHHGLINSYRRLVMLYPSTKIMIAKQEDKNLVTLSIERRGDVPINHR
ncbi:sensor histidine kinase [Streptococcus zalophi]|uniref:sensor histidine kinase n=1 Tax=Streptococcus zalophi TaxID=640031 RepID=UPI00215BBEF1|nr:histidine kinase [Streptococcus zalophi]MCR8967008.1 histidine kinase [Streptococcus zalophi]